MYFSHSIVRVIN